MERSAAGYPAAEAIFAASDSMAIGALKTIRAAGLKVPEDIALVGFDDIPLASTVEPPLTTVHQPIDRLGYLAASTLIDLLQTGPAKEDGSGAQHIVLPTELIVRASCGQTLSRVTTRVSLSAIAPAKEVLGTRSSLSSTADSFRCTSKLHISFFEEANMKGRFSILVVLLLITSMLLSACGGAAAPAAPPAAEQAAEAPATEAPAAEAPAAEAPADANTLPRSETLYFNGQQWGPVVGWNPFSNSNNNAMAIAQQDNARVIMFETPYLYNMLDGKQYPLLADGPFSWNDAHNRDSPSSSSPPPSGAMARR